MYAQGRAVNQERGGNGGRRERTPIVYVYVCAQVMNDDAGPEFFDRLDFEDALFGRRWETI